VGVGFVLAEASQVERRSLFSGEKKHTCV